MKDLIVEVTITSYAKLEAAGNCSGGCSGCGGSCSCGSGGANPGSCGK